MRNEQYDNKKAGIESSLARCRNLIGFLSAVAKKKNFKTSFCTSFTHKLFLDDSFISVWFIFLFLPTVT